VSVRYVGVDLAWGERRPTGVAVLDEDGALLHVCSVSAEDDIVAVVTEHAPTECLVAFDAPLIVTNATGNRAAETALNRDFARFDAGAHPVNASKPEVGDRPRAARIAGRLGLDLNPRSGRDRRAIEVYPHAATVALFRLGRTLKYKQKSGRTLAGMRAELLTLMSHLEGLADAEPTLRLGESPTWRALREEAEGAPRKSRLRLVEDQVDAVVCAYVALFADRRPDDVTIYGDLEDGYILTPSLPSDHAPSARDAVAPVQAYAERWPHLRQVTDGFVGLVTSVLDEAGINYLTVTGRTKSVASFAAKAARTTDGGLLYADPLVEITDQVGIRVIAYVQSDVEAVADLLADQAVVHDDRDMGQQTASEGRFGYSSRHLLISLDPDAEAPSGYEELRGQQAQIQIRTVLQHAWAEFEHEIRYKGSIPEQHASDFDRRFTLAAGLLELADREFSTIRERLRANVAEPEARSDLLEPADAVEADEDPRLTARELAAFLAGQYAEAGWSRTDHYAWIAGLVLELGITSLAELGLVVRAVDDDEVAARMDYRYPPGAVRRLDDALLWTYGERYVGLSGNEHRVEGLTARLGKLREPR